MKTLGFLAAAMLIALAILLVPMDKRYQYAFVKNDCAPKSNYIYHRIYEDTAQLDVAFIGSSHTMCGINDSIVQSTIDSAGSDLHVSNLGLCRIGRNMDYVIIKDLLTQKKPKLIVLEVKQEEPTLSHPEFGYHADIADVLVPPSIINQRYFSDLSNTFTLHLNYLRDMLSGKSYNTNFEEPHIGFAQHTMIADTATLHNGTRTRWTKYFSHPPAPWLDSLQLRYPKAYVSKIMSMAQEHHTKVVMVYIPNYGYPWPEPKEIKYYRQLGDVIVMPATFYDNDQNWMEDEHLNAQGAAILSDSVARYIITHHP